MTFFLSETGSGFGKPGSSAPPRIPRSIPRGQPAYIEFLHRSSQHLLDVHLLAIQILLLSFSFLVLQTHDL